MPTTKAWCNCELVVLRISLIEPAQRRMTLRLEGRAVGPWVTELQQACERALADGHLLTLDLAGVEFLDAKAVALLGAMRSRGVSLVSSTPFVNEQLKSAAGS